MTDLLIIIGLTLASCVAVGLIGLFLLHLVRYRSLRPQLTIATLLPVVAVATTVLINVRLMFLSAHDSLVILIALLVSLLLAALGAWLVVHRISRASLRVGAELHQLVSDSAGGTPVAADSVETAAAPRELAQVLEDLAETRRTLAESRARERAAEQSRQELVSFMSHDLRTPLAGLRALSEGLEDGVINDVPRAMSHLRATVARMSVLVDDLFALSRVQGTREAKPQTMVSLTELISDVATESTATARAQGVRLEVDLPANDRLAVLGSSDDLARALTNLTTNAIRHTDPDLLVRLEGRRTDDSHVRVAIIDSCGGIPEASIPRVFDAGWRGTPSRSGDDGGAGLGLAIARGVVESHGGEISVRNVEGGCSFEVALPVPEPASHPDLSAFMAARATNGADKSA
jgi:signal transduction histidine kinase